MKEKKSNRVENFKNSKKKWLEVLTVVLFCIFCLVIFSFWHFNRKNKKKHVQRDIVYDPDFDDYCKTVIISNKTVLHAPFIFRRE